MSATWCILMLCLPAQQRANMPVFPLSHHLVPVCVSAEQRGVLPAAAFSLSSAGGE